MEQPPLRKFKDAVSEGGGNMAGWGPAVKGSGGGGTHPFCSPAIGQIK